jgi:hypothetical protein
MIDLFQRATLFALYQASIILGIVLLPVALLARHGGITIPIHRIVDRLGRAYQNAEHA